MGTEFDPSEGQRLSDRAIRARERAARARTPGRAQALWSLYTKLIDRLLDWKRQRNKLKESE